MVSAWSYAADILDPPEPEYAGDYEGFVRERLNTFLWKKQRDILKSVEKHQRTAVPACFSSSKSFTAARLACAWLETHPPGTAKVVTTATTFKQVRGVLWPEIRIAHAEGDLTGRVNQTEWHVDVAGVERLVGVGLTARDPVAFHGHHAEYVMVILDEADGVPRDIWEEAIDALVITPEDRVVAIGNPWDPAGPFAEACKPGSSWNVVRIAAHDTPAFTGEIVPDKLNRLLMSKHWVDDKLKRWGENDPRYISKVLARFPEDVEGALIHLLWVEECQKQTLKKARPIELGVDVAEGVERDETVIVVRRGAWARAHHASRTTSIPETTGLVRRAADDLGASLIKIDGVGIGAAVYQELRAAGYPVVSLKAGASPRDPEKYLNLGAEMYAGLRDRIRDGDLDLDEEDDTTAGQLISIKAGYNSRGQLVLESKDARRKRGLGSPDRADGYALAFYPVATGDLGDTSRSNGHRARTITGDLMTKGA